MKTFPFIIALLVLNLLSWPLLSQSTYSTGQNIYDENQGIVFNREFSVDFKLHTNGYALGVNFGQLKTYYLTRYINFELGEIKHPKELRQSYDAAIASPSRVSRSFIFGKQNNFFVLRGGFGEKRYFSEKAKRKGLAIGISYEGGPSLGLLKPYYLDINRSPDPGSNSSNIRSEKYSVENASYFLDIYNIFGSSGFSKGLGELSARPGAHGKFAVHFDWGAFDEYVKAIEAGVMVDAYLQKIPILVESELVPTNENRSIFFNLYINLQLGKRW
ncbi:MAG TPA: hypothetical protein PKA00_03350 [Saprospiraceae bacterium]|nr:hypothetical protein [Saprospiraceae bacterium]HMQ81912.1 hypothetical protein [Saprospiraceae bacterium]